MADKEIKKIREYLTQLKLKLLEYGIRAVWATSYRLTLRVKTAQGGVSIRPNRIIIDYNMTVTNAKKLATILKKIDKLNGQTQTTRSDCFDSQ